MVDAVRIILLIVVLALVIGGGVGIYYQFFYHREGEDCDPTKLVDNATSYTYNSGGTCKASECESGYVLTNNTCASTAPAAGSESDSSSDPSSIANAPAATSAVACSSLFNIINSCKEADRAGIQWKWETEAGIISNEASICRDQVDHYQVEAISQWDPEWTLTSNISGKETVSAGITGFKSFFDGKAVTYKVMPKNKAGENLVGPRIPELVVDGTSSSMSCKQSSINVSPMATDWNNNKKILVTDIYLDAGGFFYENLKTYSKDNKLAEYIGEGTQDLYGGKTYTNLVVPRGGYITSDCSEDGKYTFKLDPATILENADYKKDTEFKKKMTITADCDNAGGTASNNKNKQFKSMKFVTI
jgi:hypothetical protein